MSVAIRRDALSAGRMADLSGAKAHNQPSLFHSLVSYIGNRRLESFVNCRRSATVKGMNNLGACAPDRRFNVALFFCTKADCRTNMDGGVSL
jgi:hypothetical protein